MGDIGRHLRLSLIKVGLFLFGAFLLIVYLLPRTGYDYGAFPVALDSRTAVWFFAELHLMFAAFVLGVPIFALIVECVGIAARDQRYDRLAKEFTRLLALAFTATAALGVIALLLLVVLYPAFMTYLGEIFSPTYVPYAALIVADSVLLVFYYYGWDRIRKGWHVTVGVFLNLAGTALMCIANAWATFMMSPRGVSEGTGALVSLSNAVQNPLWWPINIHRLIANVAFGGAIVAAYAAVRFLMTRDPSERSHYDWMGYVGNFIAMWALIPLPFAGYWLGREIYAYSAQMGTSLMGGDFSWLFIVQAVLIGVLFLSANYYMWLGLGRIPGGSRYLRYLVGLEVLIFLSIAVWITPHTLVASLAEARRMGGAFHPLLGVFGVMSAKNTAVNIVILATFLSFVFYRRANVRRGARRPEGGLLGPVFVASLCLFPIVFCGVNGFLSNAAHAERRIPELEREIREETTALLASTVPTGDLLEELRLLGAKQAELDRSNGTPGIHHAAGFRAMSLLFAALLAAALFDMFVLHGRVGGLLQTFIMVVAVGLVAYYGVKGYFVDADVRIGFSVYQVMAVLFAMTAVTAIDLFIWFGAESMGKIEWGAMPARSQYVLVLLAVVFTLTIGLMGIVRSGIRGSWHVYGVIRDTSPESLTPTLGYGSLVASAATATFLGMVGLIFWLGFRPNVSSRRVRRSDQPVVSVAGRTGVSR